MTHLFSNQLCGFLIDDLVDGRHGTQLHLCFDDLRAFNRHLVRQFANGNGFADHNVTVNGLSWLLEALLQSGTFTLAAFTTANSRACFFTVSFGFSVLVAFFRRTRCFCITTTATAAFYFTVVIIFSLTRMLRSGHVIVAGVFSRLNGIHTILLVFFCHAARFFGDAASFFFQLTAGFFFRFTLQLGSFIFTAGFFSLGGFGHFVCLLIAHFVFFRSVTLHFITCVAFRFFCGLTFSF